MTQLLGKRVAHLSFALDLDCPDLLEVAGDRGLVHIEPGFREPRGKLFSILRAVITKYVGDGTLAFGTILSHRRTDTRLIDAGQ